MVANSDIFAHKCTRLDEGAVSDWKIPITLPMQKVNSELLKYLLRLNAIKQQRFKYEIKRDEFAEKEPGSRSCKSILIQNHKKKGIGD